MAVTVSVYLQPKVYMPVRNCATAIWINGTTVVNYIGAGYVLFVIQSSI